MQVNVTPQDAKVVINSRTGSVVMNREVTLEQLRGSAGKSLSNSQSSGQCQPARYTVWWWTECGLPPQTQIDLRQSGGSLQSVRSSASLNKRGARAQCAGRATPMDLMSILQSMQSAGCLRAKLEII